MRFRERITSSADREVNEDYHQRGGHRRPDTGLLAAEIGSRGAAGRAGTRPRTGGYAIDFWGVGYDIAEKMGLIPRIRELGYQVREVLFVDRQGRKRGGFSVDAFSRLTNGRFTSLRRSDLAAVIYDALEGKVETLFGDSVASHRGRGGPDAGQLRSRSPRVRSIWSSVPTGCTRASAGLCSDPRKRSRSHSAITSPRSRSTGTGRAMNSSTSATGLRDGRSRGYPCATTRRCSCSSFATST